MGSELKAGDVIYFVSNAGVPSPILVGEPLHVAQVRDGMVRVTRTETGETYEVSAYLSTFAKADR